MLLCYTEIRKIENNIWKKYKDLIFFNLKLELYFIPTWGKVNLSADKDIQLVGSKIGRFDSDQCMSYFKDMVLGETTEWACVGRKGKASKDWA